MWRPMRYWRWMLSGSGAGLVHQGGRDHSRRRLLVGFRLRARWRQKISSTQRWPARTQCPYLTHRRATSDRQGARELARLANWSAADVRNMPPASTHRPALNLHGGLPARPLGSLGRQMPAGSPSCTDARLLREIAVRRAVASPFARREGAAKACRAEGRIGSELSARPLAA